MLSVLHCYLLLRLWANEMQTLGLPEVFHWSTGLWKHFWVLRNEFCPVSTSFSLFSAAIKNKYITQDWGICKGQRFVCLGWDVQGQEATFGDCLLLCHPKLGDGRARENRGQGSGDGGLLHFCDKSILMIITPLVMMTLIYLKQTHMT